MSKEERIEEIAMYLDCELFNDTLVSIHNRYCELTNNEDDHIFHMYEIDDLFAYKSVVEIIYDSKYIDINDEFLYDTIYGWHSFTDYADCDIACTNDIAKYCVEHNYDFGDSDICEMLEKEEEID